jgi:hypothetical protein
MAGVRGGCRPVIRSTSAARICAAAGLVKIPLKMGVWPDIEENATVRTRGGGLPVLLSAVISSYR